MNTIALQCWKKLPGHRSRGGFDNKIPFAHFGRRSRCSQRQRSQAMIIALQMPPIKLRRFSRQSSIPCPLMRLLKLRVDSQPVIKCTSLFIVQQLKPWSIAGKKCGKPVYLPGCGQKHKTHSYPPASPRATRPWPRHPPGVLSVDKSRIHATLSRTQPLKLYP